MNMVHITIAPNPRNWDLFVWTYTHDANHVWLTTTGYKDRQQAADAAVAAHPGQNVVIEHADRIPPAFGAY